MAAVRRHRFFSKQEDPWSMPVGAAGKLLIRAKCAPHFRRIVWELDPNSPLLKNYAHGSCPGTGPSIIAASRHAAT